MSTYTDKQIIEMIQDTTESRELAFEYLYLNPEIKNKSYSKINNLIRDKVKADDIFTDSLLAFIKNVKYNKFRGESKISTYIVAICNFQSLNYLNNLKKEKEKSNQYLNSQKDPFPKEESVEIQFLELEEVRYEAKLKRKIYRQLSSKCRDALRKKYIDESSVKEMAKIINIAVQSVKNRLSRCYEKIRELITQDLEIMNAIKKNYGRL